MDCKNHISAPVRLILLATLLAGHETFAAEKQAKDRGDDQNILAYACPGNPKERRDLTILLSFDEGMSWPIKQLLRKGTAAYSDLIKLDAERLGVLYETGKKLYGEIRFEVVDVEAMINDKG